MIKFKLLKLLSWASVDCG